MQIAKNDRVVWFDVDETLIMHDAYSYHEGLRVQVKNIVSGWVTVAKNESMIQILEEEHARGAYVILHSSGGYEWAYNVITALDLDHLVNLVASKPIAYFDDKPVEEWIGRRVYLSPATIYKPVKSMTKE